MLVVRMSCVTHGGIKGEVAVLEILRDRGTLIGGDEETSAFVSI